MNKLRFDSNGRFIGVNQQLEEFEPIEKNQLANLKNSNDLEFLKEEKKIDDIFDKKYWSLYENNLPLSPLKFSNGKTQEDVVKEITNLIESGKKIIFLHGVCGTGKSAIALNIARALGKSSIVVPIKSLQKQYEEDYMGKKQVIKTNGEKMKIAMITGRENHDSIIEPGKSCADPNLPETIKITEKNKELINEYYKENPFITNDSMPSIKNLRRLAIAPANPYWSPIIPARVELNQIKDAKKMKYMGSNGEEFIFYHRKRGCSYYDQYLAYFYADVIIYNSAKYLAEISMGRKPKTEVEIIDEADEFLDSLSNNVEINLTRLNASIKKITPPTEKSEKSIERISILIELEEANKKALGIDENKIFELKETKIEDMLKVLNSDIDLQSEIEIDETNYAQNTLEAAKTFKDSFADVFVTFRKEDDNLFANLVTTNLAKKFEEIQKNSKAIVLMSGTLHSEEVLKHIFGIMDFSMVEAESLNQGTIEILMTGKEMDCKYSNTESEDFREAYLKALELAIKKSKKPSLIHITAFKDLPSADEHFSMNFTELVPKEELIALQRSTDQVSLFKAGKISSLFTTKCARGIDFPGEMCNSVIFTRYPNPNVRDTFWKILNKTHKNYYWEFYRDKARREFLQRIYRAVRSKNDHVYVLSPDIRVIQAVRDLQLNGK